MNVRLFLTLAIPILCGCVRTESSPVIAPVTMASPPKSVSIKTTDNWNLHAELYEPSQTNKTGVVLLHQRGGEASDWKPLCLALQKSGYTALAIDLRGAGKSQRGQQESGENAPWDIRPDIAAALAKLKSLGRGQTVLIGASYGANNALRFASEKPEGLRDVVLFSPGENYHGIKTLDAAKKSRLPLLIFTAKGDGISGDSPQKIKRVSSSRKSVLVQLEGTGHGTDLLNEKTIEQTLDFLRTAQ